MRRPIRNTLWGGFLVQIEAVQNIEKARAERERVRLQERAALRKNEAAQAKLNLERRD